MSDTFLLDPRFLRRLQRLQVAHKRTASGRQAGKRRSRKLGSSVEFSDYRAYAPGDDLRRLDWNVYARIGKLFLKTFLDEQELHVSLFIDCSRSMTFGNPAKMTRAVQMAAAVGYVALHHFDRVSVYPFDRKIQTALHRLSGKGKVLPLFRFLQAVRPGDQGDLNQALQSGRAVDGKPGVSLIFSDFLFDNGYKEGLRFMQAAQQEIVLVHILAEEERHPPLQGDIRLVDSETQSETEVTVSPPVLEKYTQSVRQYGDDIASFAFSRGMLYVDVRPEQSVENTIHHVFQTAGILR
jgi:uncharacterized protein (DUF58 family)